MRKLHFWLAVACLIALSPAAALAQSAGEAQPVALDPVPEEAAALEWDEDWARFRWWEYPVSGALMFGGFGSRFLVDHPEQNWTGGILGEEELMEAWYVGDERAPSYMTYSDIPFYGSMAYRAIDDLLIAGAIRDSWDAAWQMALIDFEAFSIVAGSLWISQIWIGRERPAAARCDGTGRGHMCSEDSANKNRSFYAGHPATVITATGLTCLHHAHMPIYGAKWADWGACGAMIAISGFESYTRVAAGMHYPSDLVVGIAIGTLAGYVVPSALHYGFGGDDDDAFAVDEAAEDTSATAPRFQLMPSVVDDQPGVLLLGAF